MTKLSLWWKSVRGNLSKALPIYDFTLYLLNDSAESAMTCVKLSHTRLVAPILSDTCRSTTCGIIIRMKTQSSSVQKAGGDVLLLITRFVDRKKNGAVVMQQQIITYYWYVPVTYSHYVCLTNNNVLPAHRSRS